MSSCRKTMNLSPKKRSCTDCDVGRDRVSEMPDDVIIRILSFLPTRDAVRTVLLRRFGNLWTLVPSLNLDIFKFFHMESEVEYCNARLESDEVGRFYLFSRNVLILHKRLSIDKLCLLVDSDYDDGSISMWLRFSLDRQAKEIKYYDTSDNFLYRSSFLPNLTSQHLVTLELSNCRLDLQHHFNLVSLKKLLLNYVAMCEDAVQRLLSGCPSLQELGIAHPYDIDELTFSVLPNIHTLSLELDFEYYSWTLDLPHLKSLDLSTSGILDIIDVFRDVCLRHHYSDTNGDEYTRFTLFLEKFKEAETFQIPHCGSKIFLHSLDDLQLSQIRWKRVILELPWVSESCLVGICKLLGRLEQLEELILRTPLRGAEELEFVKKVASFRRASTNASVVFVFVPLKLMYH